MRAAYEKLLHRRPVAVKTVTGAILGFLGDGGAQALEGATDYDQRRGVAFTSLATIWNGPCMHYILARLERAHPMSLGWRSLVKKVAITQGFVNPLVFLPLFYGWTGAVLGRSADETIEKVRKEGMDTLKATWVIFTPFNILNFSVIPVRHQAVSNAAFSLVYQTALSAIANAEAAAERRRLRDATDATATAAAECPR